MTKRFTVLAGFSFAILALLISACKKPSPFGAELLGDSFADLEFTDTITVQCFLEREDSIQTNDRSGALNHFLCGQINDPVFGQYSAEIYTLFQSQSLNPQFDTTKITFDSLVLHLNYSPGGIYGDTLQPQNLRVYRLDKALKYGNNYYSTSEIPASEEIGRLDNFYPRPQRVDSLFDGVKGEFLRIRLNDDFGRLLMNIDSATWLADTAVYEFVRGLKIVCNSASTPGAMLAFDLNDTKLSRISMYYTQKSDTTSKRFDFFFRNTNKFTHFNNDYTGSEVNPRIGQQLEDKLYVHGMDGLRLRVVFPYANNFDNIAVNKAQLVLTAGEDNPWLKPADQLILTEPRGDTATVFTSDVLYALGSTGTGSLAAFGGFPEKEILGSTTKTRYRLTLSDKFQSVVDDDNAPDIRNRTVFVNVYPRTRSAKRIWFYGPKSSLFPAKLELKYTIIR